MILRMSMLLAGGLAFLGAATDEKPFYWEGHFYSSDWASQWPLIGKGILFGRENLAIVSEPGSPDSKALRVLFPRGSWSHKATLAAGLRPGGTEFLAKAFAAGVEEGYLRYYLRFSPGFDFVKGGKLPGLYGGAANTGGNPPDGKDGFTTRFMWRKGGQGEVYAYLPDSDHYGSSLGRGSWRFKPGRWQMIEQRLRLNDPGQRNGEIEVWLDGEKVFSQKKVRFRDVDSLKIDGVVFSTFFGGSDSSWAATSDCTIDFASFAVSTRHIGEHQP